MRTERESRGDAVVLDLDRLEAQAEELYLVRFVAAVKKARGEHGRYLALRAGDRTAIEAAADGSVEFLERVTVDLSDEESTS